MIAENNVPGEGDPIRCTHSHSERMVELATKWLEEYFSDGVARRPGDLEDDFTGQWSVKLEFWRTSPFYPALANLVHEGKIEFWKDAECIVWYAKKGTKP